MDEPDDERTRFHLWTRVERGEQLDELAEVCDRYAELAQAGGDVASEAAARACAEEAERLLHDGYRDSELAALLEALPPVPVPGVDDPAAKLVSEQLASVAARLGSRGERRLRPRRAEPAEPSASPERRSRRQPVWILVVAAFTGLLVVRIAGRLTPDTDAGSIASFVIGFAVAALTFGLLVRGRKRSGTGW